MTSESLFRDCLYLVFFVRACSVFFQLWGISITFLSVSQTFKNILRNILFNILVIFSCLFQGTVPPIARNRSHPEPSFLWMSRFLFMLRVVGMIWKEADILWSCISHVPIRNTVRPARHPQGGRLQSLGSCWKGSSSKSQETSDGRV